jgi:hypothetical protein
VRSRADPTSSASHRSVAVPLPIVNHRSFGYRREHGVI